MEEQFDDLILPTPKLPSHFQPGDKCILQFYNSGLVERATILAVKFTIYGKVLYDISINTSFVNDEITSGEQAIIKDVDSNYVKEV
jgi:hypothetical protein